MPRIRTGTMVKYSGADYFFLWTHAEFAAAFGRPFDALTDHVSVLNGDANAAPVRFYAPEVWNSGIYAYFSPAYTGNVRVNWMVVLGH